MEVNPETWASVSESQGYASMVITRDESQPLLESATLETTGEVAEGYHRIEAVVEQDAVEVFPISTIYIKSGTKTSMRGATVTMADGYSVLHEASLGKVEPGSFAPAGMDGALFAADLLGKHVKCPIIVVGSFRIERTIVFDLESSPVDAARAVLDDAGWVMTITGRGELVVKPGDSGPDPAIPAITKANTFDGYTNDPISYKREFFPGLFPSDTVEVDIEGFISGVFNVKSQTIHLGKGATVEEVLR